MSTTIGGVKSSVGPHEYSARVRALTTPSRTVNVLLVIRRAVNFNPPVSCLGWDWYCGTGAARQAAYSLSHVNHSGMWLCALYMYLTQVCGHVSAQRKTPSQWRCISCAHVYLVRIHIIFGQGGYQVLKPKDRDPSVVSFI